MRALILGVLTLVTVVYVVVALTIHRQANWAFAPDSIDLASSSDIAHPEAALSVIRRAFTSGDYSDAIRPILERSLSEVPSSYRAALLHTVFRANRLEEPGLIRRGFETAIERFPTNGRLHLTYARWLMTSWRRADEGFGYYLHGGKPARNVASEERPLTMEESKKGEESEAYHLAVNHLKEAMVLEEELIAPGLDLLRWGGVPAEAWSTLIPETPPARRQLLHMLVRSGQRGEALALLERLIGTETEVELFREASSWALQWSEPQLALEAAGRWREHEIGSGKTGLELARATLVLARAHMDLGDPDSAHGIVSETLELMERQPRSTRPARLELLNGLGYEYLRVGQTVLARSTFLKARALAPYDTTSSLGLARAYRRTGDRDAAIEQYRRVLELDRHNPEAKRELQELPNKW